MSSFVLLLLFAAFCLFGFGFLLVDCFGDFDYFFPLFSHVLIVDVNSLNAGHLLQVLISVLYDRDVFLYLYYLLFIIICIIEIAFTLF